MARDFLQHTTFILNNADLAVAPNTIVQLVNSSFDDLILIDCSEYNKELMKVSIDENGYVRDISKNISPGSAFGCSINFHKFSADGSDILFSEITNIIEQEKNLKDWVEVAMQRLFQSGKLLFKSLNIAPQPWIEVDDYDDVLLGCRKFSKFDDDIKDINNIFFDLDGTIYIGDELISGTDDLVNCLLREGKNLYFSTNNSSKSKKEYVKKLVNFNINVDEDSIIFSTDSLIEYLNSRDVKKIYALGTEACKQYLRDKNFDLDSTEPEYVIITYDTEINYSKLIEACRYINAGVDILATHGDGFCPSEVGPIPDAGSFIAMFRVATGKSPIKIFGKPNVDLFDTLIKNRKINLDDCLVVGDRIDTDIKMANEIGCKSLLVLSGESTLDMLDKTDIQPTYVLNSLAQW